MTDLYRDVAAPGGVVDRGFGTFWWSLELEPTLREGADALRQTEGEIVPNWHAAHPVRDRFWAAKTPKLQDIQVPMLVCASFSDHGLHTIGSFRAFLQAGSADKWLYTHRDGKWDVFYSSEVQELTRRFFDAYCKEDAPPFEQPRVRLEVRSSASTVHEVRTEQDWPLQRSAYRKLCLSQAMVLQGEACEAASTVSYDAERGRAVFEHRFSEATELTGYMKAHLWLEARNQGGAAPADLGLVATIQKLDGQGKVVPFLGSVGNKHDAVARGYCRASRRRLDPSQSTDYWPALTLDREELLAPGEVVEVDVGIWPSSTWFEAGSSMRLTLSGHEVVPTPVYTKEFPYNRGTHVIHLGGDRASYLQVPVIAD